MHSVERWVGHQSIPKRVFRPTEYLTDPPKWPAKPQTMARPLHHVGSGPIGSFEATRSQRGGCDQKPKEQSLGAKFAAWFDTTFADSNPQWKQKAILANQEAAMVILMKAQHCGEGPTEASNTCRPKATQGHQATRVEYKPETEDIHMMMELGSGYHPTLGETIQWQIELNKIHPRKSFHLRRTHSVTQSPPRSADQP